MSMFTRQSPDVHLLVIQHTDMAPGGIFEQGLRTRGCTLTILSPFEGDPLPQSPGIFSGLVVLGGPQHAFDDQAGPHFPQLMALMRAFETLGKPVAGICLGCQLLARAHGGTPKALGFLELGFSRHTLTPAGKADPVLGNLDLPPLMSFHEDTFDLPENAVLLARGDRCRNQAFRAGEVSYGFQFHLEVTRDIAGRWIDQFKRGKIDAYDNHRKGFQTTALDEMETGLESYIHDSETFCDRIAENWLALVSRRNRLR